MQISPAQIQLTGKGRKTRSVPLMEQTVCILKEYMKRNGLDNGLNGDHPLFFNAQEKKTWIGEDVDYFLTSIDTFLLLRSHYKGFSIYIIFGQL